MKRHLNTLYITSPDAFIHKEGETFVVELDGKKALQAPAVTIENIDASASSRLRRHS